MHTHQSPLDDIWVADHENLRCEGDTEAEVVTAMLETICARDKAAKGRDERELNYFRVNDE
jgi:hypothetical protein